MHPKQQTQTASAQARSRKRAENSSPDKLRQAQAEGAIGTLERAAKLREPLLDAYYFTLVRGVLGVRATILGPSVTADEASLPTAGSTADDQ